MQLITRQQQAEGVLAKWLRQYRLTVGDLENQNHNNENLKIAQKIVAAGENADAIDAAIGNGSWTHLGCSICNKAVTAVVAVGDDSEDCCTFYFCKECCKRMVSMFTKE